MKKNYMSLKTAVIRVHGYVYYSHFYGKFYVINSSLFCTEIKLKTAKIYLSLETACH